MDTHQFIFKSFKMFLTILLVINFTFAADAMESKGTGLDQDLSDIENTGITAEDDNGLDDKGKNSYNLLKKLISALHDSNLMTEVREYDQGKMNIRTTLFTVNGITRESRNIDIVFPHTITSTFKHVDLNKCNCTKIDNESNLPDPVDETNKNKDNLVEGPVGMTESPEFYSNTKERVKRAETVTGTETVGGTVLEGAGTLVDTTGKTFSTLATLLFGLQGGGAAGAAAAAKKIHRSNLFNRYVRTKRDVVPEILGKNREKRQNLLDAANGAADTFQDAANGAADNFQNVADRRKRQSDSVPDIKVTLVDATLRKKKREVQRKKRQSESGGSGIGNIFDMFIPSQIGGLISSLPFFG